MMSQEEIKADYFSWLCDFIIFDGIDFRYNYSNLLNKLYDFDFLIKMTRDGNRESDGVELRYNYGTDFDIRQPIIASYLDNRCSSMLEMMIALAIKCEGMMLNPNEDYATGKWFWIMIDNLGLTQYNDDNFNELEVEEILWRFIDRKYDPDGKGGLFHLHSKVDLRGIEIWTQMLWFVNEYSE